jgi:ribosome-binding factor A
VPREFSRVDRVEEAIHRAVAELLLREVGDPRIAHLTVSRVRVSRDLTHAKVYVVVPDDGQAARDALRGLRHAGGFLRSGVARRLMMRTVPELQFVPDTSLAEGNRLAALIESAAPRDDADTGREDDQAPLER